MRQSQVTQLMNRIGGRLSRHPTLVATALYLAVTLIWDHSMVLHPRTTCNCYLPGDPTMFVWALAWYPHALLHGLPLFEAHNVWAPTGQNLAATTTFPFEAFLFAPVTLLFGPIVSYALITFLSPILSSLAVYWLCRYISKAPFASILAGATYGFGTFAVSHLGSHPQLFIAMFPPLIVLCMLKLIDGNMRPRWFVVAVAAMLVAQIGTGSEVFFTMTLLGAVALIAGYIFSTRERRSAMLAAARWLALAYAIALVICSYYIYLELSGPPAAKGWGLLYWTDLMSFFVPAVTTWIGGVKFTPVMQTISPATGETNAYLGLVLILIVVHYISTSWPSRLAKFLVVMIVVTVLWILGGVLHVAGHATIWLPYNLLARLPVFDEVMQGRNAAYLEIICAIVLALWLGNPRGSNRRKVARWVVGIVAVAMVMPNIIHPYQGNIGHWQNPKFFTTDMYKRYIPRHSRLVVLRWWADSNFSMLWQAEDHFYYNLSDGSFSQLPHSWLDSKLDFDLFENTPKAGDGPRLRGWLILHHVENVVVEPEWESTWRATLAAAGLKKRQFVGGIYLYPVPAAWLAPGAPGARQAEQLAQQ